jgi:hypothetical protein
MFFRSMKQLEDMLFYFYFGETASTIHNVKVRLAEFS